MRGNLLHAEGQHETALKILKQAESVQIHNRPSLYLKMGECYLSLRFWAKAETEFNRALAIDPVNPAPYYGLCRVYLKQRKHQQALESAKAVLGLVFHYPQAHLACGIALHRLGQIKEAVTAIETAIAQNPVFPDAHRRLAYIYSKQLLQAAKGAEHRRLARETRQRISDYKAGKNLPSQAENESLEVIDSLASLNHFETYSNNKPLSDDTVVLVSGLPRSGTSMMMQMLDAGGLPILSDSHRLADDDNPKGYFEFEGVKKMGRDDRCLDDAGGKAVKVIAQLLPRLPTGRPYRIIFMERPLNEVLPSQTAMLQRNDRKVGDERALALTYSRQIAAVKKVLEHYPDSIQLLSVRYHDALRNPEVIAEQLDNFLGGGLNQTAMCAAVEPMLHRQKASVS